MNIVVPIKQVPDLVEELEINEDGTDLDRDYLSYKINEFDDHAIEEALLLKEEYGGSVTVMALDGEETDKLLYTAIAKGADRGVKVMGDLPPGTPTHTVAKAMANALSGMEYDLILTGVQAADDRDGQLGVILANYLGLPHISVVSEVKVNGNVASVHKEYSGGVMAEFEVDLPAVLGIQAARQTPRYAPVSRVRQIMRQASLDEVEAGDVSTEVGSSVRRLFKPEKGAGAKMLEGTPEEIADQIIEILREKGIKK
ncbi:MAG: electron transfer flavoprotein subunit beta/FixA family protein [Calditrichaeota bacterium]|nr:MAG: electron transfer flavoprotein subunit beta/FixA family protein [Calditrichota bacterium]